MGKKKLWLIPAILIPLILIAILAVLVFFQLKTGGEAPSVELEVYDGPDYSESDDMCYYRVEAIASGTPEPKVTFEDDDNIKQIGPGRVEVAVETGKSYNLRATATNSSGAATATITLFGECGQELAEKEEEETTETEETEEAEEEEDEETPDAEEAEGVFPTIALEIYEGPTPADGLCFYRVKATVTGTPTPTVEWSKDDSSGAWGTRRVQVNLGSPDETYTLTATATNSKGTATESITLSWGCPIPTPETAPPVTVVFPAASRGYVTSSGDVFLAITYLAGDSNLNEGVQSFATFDVSSIPLSATIVSARLEIISYSKTGDPFGSLGPLRVYLHNYGTLGPGDYTQPPVFGPIVSFNSEAHLSDPARQELNDRGISGIQDALPGSKFQIRFQFSDKETDNDNAWDMVSLTAFRLIVRYRP